MDRCIQSEKGWYSCWRGLLHIHLLSPLYKHVHGFNSHLDAATMEPIILDRAKSIRDWNHSFGGDKDLIITVGDGTFADHRMTAFALPPVYRVKQLILGDKCLTHVHSFVLEGLSELRELRVGKSSCTTASGLMSIARWDDGVCRIANCPNLVSIQFDDLSFSQYVRFQLEQVASLQSLCVGKGAFYHAEELTLKACSNGTMTRLQSVELGEAAFHACHAVAFEGTSMGFVTIRLATTATNRSGYVRLLWRWE